MAHVPANTITAVIPKILAKGLMTLRQRVLYTRLVNLDYSEEAKQKGNTIDVPISSALTTSAVQAAVANATPTDSAITTTQILLNDWRKVNFALTDKDMMDMRASKDFVPLQMGEAFKAMANYINGQIAALHTSLYGSTGTANTTPFGAGVEVASATNARKLLNLQLADKENRRGILDFDAEAAALNLSQFSDAEKVGSSGVKITGELGRKFGIDWYADNAVPTHTAGTLGGAAVTQTINKAGTAIALGAKTCTMTVGDTTAMALVVGDTFTFAGDTQQYVATAVAAGAAAADVTVNFYPGKAVAATGGEAVTGAAGTGYGDGAGTANAAVDHVANMVFHRDCFALAMRAPGEGLKEFYNNEGSFTMGDPVSGLVFRLELIRNHKMVTWELDALFGVKCVRPELGVKILG